MFWESMLFHNAPCMTIFVAIVIQCSIGSAENTKRQNLIPSARLGREIFFSGADIPLELRQSLEGNMKLSSSDPDYIESEILLNAESDNEKFEDALSSEATVDRKKRSLSQEQPTENKHQSQQTSEELKSKWNKETQNNFFKTAKRSTRNRIVFIPRIGKKSYDTVGSYANKRAVFIPRIGKKSFAEEDFSEEKRAIFIPRIGKRNYVNLDNPEIKKAIFIPRIGRGAAIMSKIRYNPQNRSNGRVVFIPRIG